MIGSLPIEEFSYGLDVTGIDPASLGDALRAVTTEVMSDPVRMSAWIASFSLAEQAVGVNLMRRLNGEAPEPVISPDGDKRFSDAAWRSNPFLFGALEEYLVRTRAAQQLIELSRAPENVRRKARFALNVMLDAAAPSNVPWLNPAVVKEAVDTGGASLVRGMQQFLDDLEHNGGMPRQVDTSSFRLGENIAATPGRVVFRNELIELIAYEPTTPTVHERPLLMSPPWINKYYIMDLAPGRSFAQWAVSHGHRTFMISYRNPDASMSGLTMDDYLRLGMLTAIDAVERLTGARRINVAALCLGGTLAVLALAHLAALGDDERIASCTVTNTLVDFAEPGDLGVFTDATTIERLEKRMNERGYLDSSEMAGTFNWMRANDLVWSYVVNNWFMGRKPPAFDLLAWNADSTRMPAAMHSQYLRTCYLDNALVRPGAFTVCGTPVDLGKIRTPMFVLGAEADHIAPWRSTFSTASLISGPATFVLTNSGHIAGIVNPPGGKKSWYWESSAKQGESADAWLSRAAKHEGSWWHHWAAWIEPHAGKRIKPAPLPQGEPAPGYYVRNQTAPPFDASPPERAAKPASRTRSAPKKKRKTRA